MGMRQAGAILSLTAAWVTKLPGPYLIRLKKSIWLAMTPRIAS